MSDEQPKKEMKMKGPVETITWFPVDLVKPDCDTTVLCWADGEIYCGYWDSDSERWISCESGGALRDVTHWTSPNGPESQGQGHAH